MNYQKERTYEQIVCPRCGASFTCSASAKCWCYEVDVPAPVLELIQEKWNSCLCPACLGKLAKDDEKSFG